MYAIYNYSENKTTNLIPLFFYGGRLFLLALLLASCANNRTFYAEKMPLPEPPSDRLLYSIFLIGDTGDATADLPIPPLRVLKQQLAAAGERSAVVFLGDNLYPDGLPHEDAKSRTSREKALAVQLDMLRDYPGQIVFIPGNHDWDSSGKQGLQAVNRMEEFVEGYLDRGNIFLPDDGFPGPVDLKLMDKDDDPQLTRDIHLVILDTQWWLHPHEKSFGDTGEYELEDGGDFINELTDIMRKHQNDHVVVAAHHPLFANGTHGGNFPLMRHVLPPVGGTAYVLYRKFLGYPQDIAHFRYQSLKKHLLQSFDKAESLVYASGHQHVLQHNIIAEGRYSRHHVVSGSGSTTDYIARGEGAEFASNDRGFSVINYYADRSSWLEFWNEDNELLYRYQLLPPDENPFVEVQKDSLVTQLDDSVTVAPNPKYDQVGWVHRGVLGAHNRDLWSVPVEVPVFDVSSVNGGLDVIKMGGTGQSTTLRLQDNACRSYVLRSIDKEAARVWDPVLRNTLANDLAQDQFSMINPYGALMVPPLAEAASIYHTNPTLYAIPDDPRLGRFADTVGGKLALFEERPDEDMSHAPHLSGSENVISTRDLFRELDADIDHRVDQRMMLRNRLLDMLVADWDRHEDQWRWAAFEPEDGKGKIYQPIPRDRDMAFGVMNGLLPTVGKTTFFLNYQDFREHYGNLKGLTKNSLPLTRRFTNQLTKRDWLAIADSMQQVITDDIIEEAVARMPAPIIEKEGQSIKKILKQRRDKLSVVAEKYYDLLARVTDVVGSHKREKFTISAYPADSVRVQVMKLKKEGTLGSTYFDRVFYRHETKELRLYGLGGDDIFEIDELASNVISIRIVGGTGSDEFTGAERSDGRIYIYDTAAGSTLRNINNFRIHTSGNPEINQYKYGFRYNRIDPLIYFGSNRDDGVFLGGGVRLERHGFRKDPAAAIHRIRGNFALETEAFNIRYDGHFAGIAGEWDGLLKMDMLLPNNIRNFYGLGNETADSTRNDDFYQARLWQYKIQPMLQRALVTGVTLSVGPFFQVTKVREDEGRFVGQPQAGISPSSFDDQWFVGLQANLGLASVDSEINPRQGFRWNNNMNVNLGIRNISKTYSSAASAVSMYWSPVWNPQLTVATRFGIAHNWGAFPFYKSNTLGGKNTLRGLLSNRYAGRTRFVNNIETRAKLLDFQNYLLGGEAGVLAFFDHGRVWTDDEESSRWHYGAGGGLWVSLFNMTVIRGSIGFSEGSYNMLIGAGFFF